MRFATLAARPVWGSVAAGALSVAPLTSIAEVKNSWRCLHGLKLDKFTFSGL